MCVPLNYTSFCLDPLQNATGWVLIRHFVNKETCLTFPGLAFCRGDISELLEDADLQVCDSVEKHGHWHLMWF